MMGRPSTYTDEIAAEICERVADGDNLNAITKEGGYPTRTTVYKWLLGKPDFADNYARAREARADSRSDRIDEYVKRTLTGEIDPSTARVAIDAEKWQAGREAPKKYGDKLDLNHGGQNGENPVALEVNFVKANG